MCTLVVQHTLRPGVYVAHMVQHRVPPLLEHGFAATACATTPPQMTHNRRYPLQEWLLLLCPATRAKLTGDALDEVPDIELVANSRILAHLDLDARASVRHDGLNGQDFLAPGQNSLETELLHGYGTCCLGTLDNFEVDNEMGVCVHERVRPKLSRVPWAVTSAIAAECELVAWNSTKIYSFLCVRERERER